MLVERIINKVIKDNINIDELLVVTFTNAAASEMKEKILDAIYKKLEENPDDENLQKQIMLLNMASICTIDSFCLDVVKSNFYELENVSPNFRIADTPEIELLKQEVLDELFEEKYLSEDKEFTKLINTYTGYRDDSPLKELILKIDNYIASTPFPVKWLNEKIENFNLKDKINEDFSTTIWGKVLIDEVKDEILDDLAILSDTLENLSHDEQLEKHMKVIETDIKLLNSLNENLDNWDKAYELTQKISFADWPRKKIESEIKDEAKVSRDAFKEKFKKKINKIFVSNSRQSMEDIYDMYHILKMLENLIVEFKEKMAKVKQDKNIFDFSDIEHFALNILVKDIDENGNIEKTEVAKRYTEKFKEIAIDEYQDSNLVQEYILSSISDGKNMFMVGDVKQSIYRFRQAMPKLFLDKYETYEDIENKNARNRKIKLFKNFRSRFNVLEFTNLIFENIMSYSLGEIDYTKEEYLNFGAKYYKDIDQNLKIEIDIIDAKKDKEEIVASFYDEENEDKDEEKEEIEYVENIEIEARYVANKIKELVDNKYQVCDTKKEKFRDIKYRDISILLRSTKNKANVYEQELTRLGIPVFADSNQEYLNSIEIQTIINLLKIIDNPIQDIPLVAVLRSVIGGFTDDELIQIRLSDKYDNFYNCIEKAKIDVNENLREKITTFLDKINNWRKEQEYLSLDELIWKIYSDTGFYNFVGLLQNGNQRQANLKMLFEHAKNYESASFKGLYNFINFIDKLKEKSGDLSSAKIIGENDDVVRIMSIHKSKGLEFSVVFLSNTNKQFNEQDIRKDPVLLHQNLGIGAKYIDYNAQIQYDTLTREAVKNIISNENISEEMRVLYVALTRAKEKLFITGIVNDLDKKLESMEKQHSIYKKEDDKISNILVKKYKSYLDWILLVKEYNKKRYEEVVDFNVIDLDDILKENNVKLEKTDSNKIIEILNKKDINEDELERIKNIIEFKYIDELSTKIPTKTSVTKIKQMKQNRINDIDNLMEVKYTEFDKPKFIKNDEEKIISAAEKGTLIHLCLQKLNEKENYDIQKVKDLVDGLVIEKIITDKEADAINLNSILKFTKSNIWKELIKAKEVNKEKPFYINVSAKEIFDENIDESILVQGIIDLYYIDEHDNLILIDYKTDYIENGKEAELIDKYKSQLDLYKDALEKSLNKKVYKAYIYSTFLGKEIEYNV